MSTTQTPSATELEAAALKEIEQAKRAQADARRAVAEAQADFTRATKQREQAIADQIRGVRGADRRLSVALEAAQGAASRLSAGQERGEIAGKVERDARARLQQIRETLLAELSPSAELLTKEFIAARDALAEPLRRYVESYRRAAHRWGELEPGTRARVEEADRERGNFERRKSAIDREATTPELPISAALVRVLLGVTPRPAVMHESYAPDRPLSAYVAPSKPVATDETVQPLDPSDPRYEKHHGDATREARTPDGTPTRPGAYV